MLIRLIKLSIVLATLVVMPAAAQEYQPFPNARITQPQWRSYFESVKKTHGESQRAFPDEHLLVYQDRDGRMFWAFTTPGHPAHPAWITRQVIEEAGEVKVNQIGYFAGDEPAFARLFQQYLSLTERTVKESQDSNDDKPPAARTLSFDEAQDLVAQSKLKPGYEQYLSTFAQRSNSIKLDERGGCYALNGGTLKLIIVLNDKGLIESAISDVNSEKAQCFKRMYTGVDLKTPPPYSPLAIEVIVK